MILKGSKPNIQLNTSLESKVIQGTILETI